MSDFFSWSLDLGRWAGSRVRIHVSLLLTLVLTLIFSPREGGPHFLPTLMWLCVYVFVLILHEGGHLLAAWWQDSEPEDVYLWPLGNLILPTNRRVNENPIVLAGGLVVSGVCAIGSAIILAFFRARMQLNPFGGDIDSGAPMLIDSNGLASPLTPLWYLGWFGWLNWLLFLINMLPALPFDMGRILRATVSRTGFGLKTDAMIGPWAGHTVAAFLGVIGVLRLLLYQRIDAISVIVLAVFIEVLVRLEARMMEDGSFYDDGVFGYDFSEGYTSLESSAAKVRPRRESVLKRWRRRRSDQRKQRKEAQFAAEERRLDEILDKIHHHGKSSLSDEEQRFLVRVSSRIRKRSQT